MGGYYCEVHHVTPYAQCRTTDINDLTFACGPDHRLLEKGWTTRKNARSDTEWTPPAHHDYGQPEPTPSATPKNSRTPATTMRTRRSDPGFILTNVGAMDEQHRTLVLMRHAKSAYPTGVAESLSCTARSDHPSGHAFRAVRRYTSLDAFCLRQVPSRPRNLLSR